MIRLADKVDFHPIVTLLEQLSDSPRNNLAATAYYSTLGNDDYITVVYEKSVTQHPMPVTTLKKVVGIATLVLIKKTSHAGKPVGQIEDVVVDNNYRRQGIGQSLVKTLLELAKEKECYKVQLNCTENNVPFYNECGFHKNQQLMRIDL